jgi:3-oxoadipate enol-lactonase / 4-carboxymuconolactone decarboxylase
MTFKEINGHTIHYKYLQTSSERTFIFINSLGTDFRIWDDVIEILKNHGSTLCFDKQGHGLSEVSSTPLSISDYAQDVVGLMDALSIPKAVIVGLSIGGVIGQYLAVHHANRIEKLVLSNTAPKIGTAETWDLRINKLKNDGIQSITEGVMKVWFSENFHQTRPNELIGYANMLGNSPIEGYIQACEALKSNDLTTEITHINIPTLCIAGSVDGSTPPALVKAMADKIPSAQYVEIEGAGHIPCVETPSVVAAFILNFVENHTETLFEKGMRTRRSVLGDAHVDRAEANKTDFDKDFQEYITNSAWGAIWSRPGLTKRERSMITIAVLAALGHEEELAMHFRATRNTGASVDDVKEVLLHIGIYAGVPVTNGAMKIAKEVFGIK